MEKQRNEEIELLRTLRTATEAYTATHRSSLQATGNLKYYKVVADSVRQLLAQKQPEPRKKVTCLHCSGTGSVAMSIEREEGSARISSCSSTENFEVLKKRAAERLQSKECALRKRPCRHPFAL